MVVDDGSTDQTPQIVKKYQNEISIIYIRLEESVGACRARNKGIEEASGEFIAGLDDDDSWHKDRIKELVKVYSDDFSAVASDVIMIYPKTEMVWKKNEIIDLDTLLYTNQVGNQVMARRDRILEIGGFDEELPAAQDYDLWVRLCEAFGPIRNVQKPLQTIYMDHQSGRITDRSSFDGYLKFYQKHKYRMNRKQRKYQLYKIRRAQGKSEALSEFISCVPRFRYWKEMKRIAMSKITG